MINKASGAKEEYSKGEAKEKVSLLLSEYTIENATGENTDFAKLLRKNLQVGVAQNGNNTYSFMLGKWQVVTTTNNIISIEKFKLDADKIYTSVASMKADTELTAGKLVQTEGYWNKAYGGSAYYDIVSNTSLTVDDGKCIQLDNGLYAELHAINDTVTVNQFGAYGDGIQNDSEAIKKSVNSGYKNIELINNQTYIVNTQIYIENSDVYIFSKDSGAIILAQERFENNLIFNLHQVNNIVLTNINFDMNSSYNSDIAIGGVSIYQSQGIDINNCTFNGTGQEATAITSIKSSNINIEKNKMLRTDCGFMTIGGETGEKYENFIISENFFDGQRPYSEPITFFDNSNYNNIKIINNVIQDKTYASGIYTGNGKYTNVYINNNNIRNCSAGMSINNTSNCVIENNIIEGCENGLFIVKNENITISNNKINNSKNMPIILNGVNTSAYINKNSIIGHGSYGFFVNSNIMCDNVIVQENQILQNENYSNNRSVVIAGYGNIKFIDNVIDRSMQFMNVEKELNIYVRTKQYECNGEIMFYYSDKNEYLNVNIEYIE